MNEELFCKLYTSYNGEEISNVEQIKRDVYTGIELYEFCKFIYEEGKVRGINIALELE